MYNLHQAPFLANPFEGPPARYGENDMTESNHSKEGAKKKKIKKLRLSLRLGI